MRSNYQNTLQIYIFFFINYNNILIYRRNNFQKLVTSNASDESTPRTVSSNVITNIGENDTGDHNNNVDETMNIHRRHLESESSGNYGYDYADDEDTTDQEELNNNHIFSPRYQCFPHQKEQIHQLQQLQQQKLQLLQQQHEQLNQQQQTHDVHYYHENNPKNIEVQVMTGKDLRKCMKVRKVKSEMKYVDTPTLRDGSKRDKKKESKSDHEFANDSDVSDHNFPNIVCDILWNFFINNVN